MLHSPSHSRFRVLGRAGPRGGFALLAVAASLLAGPSAPGAIRGERPQTVAAATVVSGSARVRDGDTIVVSGVPVRLAGLHCDERGARAGERAAAAMRRLVADGGVVCRLSDRRSYDRRIGTCAVAGRDLGEALIRQGLCARCPRHDADGRYVPAQRAAGPWPSRLPPYC